MTGGREHLVRDAAAAGMGRRLGWGRRPALLLVDVVRAYFTPGSPLYLDRPDVVESCVRLREAAHRGGAPVLATVVRYAAGAVDAGLFVRKVPALQVFAAGAAGGLGELVPELAPQAQDVVVPKQYASAFFGTSLASTLRALDVDTVVVVGTSTSGCVRASAVDALQHGLRPMVVASACGDRHPDLHDANLHDLDTKYADLVTEDEAARHLSGQAGPYPGPP